jgi:hypothetical protein
MRRSRTPADDERERRTLQADLSQAICKARRRRRILRGALVTATLVLALCLLILGNPI